MLRRAVAFFGHAPGLWLCYRETVPPQLRIPNAIAAGLTLVAMAVAYGLANGRATLVAWAIGHVMWGTFFAVKLPNRKLPN